MWKKSRKQKNDSNRRGEYQKFDEVSTQMRESMIKLDAEKVIAHAAANSRSCHPGFVKELVNKAAQIEPLLKITCNDVNNKVSNRMVRPMASPRGHGWLNRRLDRTGQWTAQWTKHLKGAGGKQRQ
jgi:hypothetical protein